MSISSISRAPAAIDGAQIKRIHTLKGKVGLADGDYRDLLQRLTGKRSSKDLSFADAARIISHLQKAAGDAPSGGGQLAGKYAGILRALWLDGWQLGVVRSSTDAALIAFVQRQTGVSHTRFLTEAEDARPAIEGLKKWLAREAGVEWPTGRGDVEGAKRAVALAQFERLVAIGAWPPFGSQARPGHRDLAAYAYRHRIGVNALEHYGEREWDWLITRLGVWLRGALKARAAK
ncbi:MAG TPA: regulatory protein GemA [Ancylobacter sp.]